jgi:hypothetical protein
MSEVYATIGTGSGYLRLLEIRIQFEQTRSNFLATIRLALAFDLLQLFNKRRLHVSLSQGNLLKHLHNLLEPHILRTDNRAGIAKGAIPDGCVTQELLLVSKVNHADKFSRIKLHNGLMDRTGRRTGAASVAIGGKSSLQIYGDSVFKRFVNG